MPNSNGLPNCAIRKRVVFSVAQTAVFHPANIHSNLTPSGPAINLQKGSVQFGFDIFVLGTMTITLIVWQHSDARHPFSPRVGLFLPSFCHSIFAHLERNGQNIFFWVFEGFQGSEKTMTGSSLFVNFVISSFASSHILIWIFLPPLHPLTHLDALSLERNFQFKHASEAAQPGMIIVQTYALIHSKIYQYFVDILL